MKVVILCGGKGTRLSEETKNIPKPMVKIGSYPILEHIINIYKKFGYKDLNKAVEDEVPNVLNIIKIKGLFKKIDMHFLALWEDMPQLYIFLNLTQ